MTKAFTAIILRDTRLGFFRGCEGMTALLFFIVVISLFPFALGPQPEILKAAASGILWVAMLLAGLLSLENIWHRDFYDGTLDAILLAGHSGFKLMAAKIFAHWLISGLPLVILSIPAALMLQFPVHDIPVLLLSLLLGAVYMSLLGGFGAVLTFGARRPGMLLALLILPLLIPMMILGVMTGSALLVAAAVKGYLLLQTALLVAAIPLVLGGGAQILKLQMRSL